MLIHSLEVDKENENLRTDVFLKKNLPEISSRSFIQRLIESGNVLVNSHKVKAHHKVCCGDKVEITIVEQKQQDILPENIPIDIFYEDADILVINKSVGIVVHPGAGQHSGTLVNALLHHCKELSNINDIVRPGIVHRLDKETSGLLLVAKNNTAHVKLARQFERRLIKKCYIALVQGKVEFDEGVVDVPIGRHPRHREKKAVVFSEARESKTIYRVIKRFRNSSLVALYPKTGRTHQLRVHMAYLKHPILGDSKYGKSSSFSRLALHAQSIGFKHPRTLTFMEFCTKIPQNFKEETS